MASEKADETKRNCVYWEIIKYSNATSVNLPEVSLQFKLRS